MLRWYAACCCEKQFYQQQQQQQQRQHCQSANAARQRAFMALRMRLQ
jgi:hypothetical protein